MYKKVYYYHSFAKQRRSKYSHYELYDSRYLFVFLLYIDRNTIDCIWYFVNEMHDIHTQNHNKYKTYE